MEENFTNPKSSLKLLLEHIQKVAIVIDANQEVVLCNESSIQELGLDGSSYIGMEISNLFSDEKQVENLFNKKLNQSYFCNFKRQDQSTFCGKAKVEPIEIHSKEKHFLITIDEIQNISLEENHSLIEKELRYEPDLYEAKKMLDLVIKTIPIRLFWKDTSSVYLGCNHWFAVDAGLESPAQIVGKTDYDLWPLSAELYRSDDANVMGTGIPKMCYEEPQDREDGSHSWLNTSKVPLKSEDGQVIGVLGTYEDITDRKLAERAFLSYETRLRMAQEGAQVGSWELDVLGNKAKWSKPMLKLCGYSDNELGDSFDNFKKLIVKDSLDQFESAFEKAIKSRSSFRVLHQIKAKDSSLRWFETRGTIDHSDDDLLVVVGISIDVTTQVKKEKELASAKQLAEESNRLKSEFLSIMSHEIKTPLNAIVGIADVIHSFENIDEEMKLCTDSILKNSKRLEGMMEDIVEISLLKSGQKQAEYSYFDLHKFLKELHGSFEELAETKNIEDFRISSFQSLETEFMVYSDKEKLRQVFFQLLVNAFKFTESGVIEFGCKEYEMNSLQFFVSDTGIGVPDAMQKAIFEPFRQVDQSNVRKFEGSGTGLSICDEIILLLKGEIGVISKEGQGSNFFFNLACRK